MRDQETVPLATSSPLITLLLIDHTSLCPRAQHPRWRQDGQYRCFRHAYKMSAGEVKDTMACIGIMQASGSTDPRDVFRVGLVVFYLACDGPNSGDVLHIALRRHDGAARCHGAAVLHQCR